MAVLLKGTILENTYEIIEEIGSGGGGVVYKARHLRLQTDVVVKKMKDEVRGKLKSRQEADILKNLKHPYLPRVYDFIETEDGVYTVMDFIHGVTLLEALRKHGKYTEKQVRKWAGQLGEALDYLHSQKPAIIHSDIKPANIMLTQDDNVCLIDFNIALAMGGTMESSVGISAGFSPPEQYRDSALYAKMLHKDTKQRAVSADAMEDKTEVLAHTDKDKTEVLADTDKDRNEVSGYTDEDKTEVLESTDEDRTEILPQVKTTGTSQNPTAKYTQYIGRGIDTRSDIYSLGIVLCYMLTGIEPSADFEKRIPLSETNTAVSEGFACILDKMTQPAPEDRYRSGTEFLKAVRNCYKLDRRYIAMHRKQTVMQFASIACLVIGILFIFSGLYKIRVEKNGAYYGFLQQAVEAMNQYELEDAGNLLESAKKISQERIDAYVEEVYLLYLSGKYEECISLGEKYINTMPFRMESQEDEEQMGNLYYIMGNACFETQDYTNGVDFFGHALEYYADNGAYYRDYAITLAKMGQADRAQDILDSGIARGIGQDSIYMAQGEIAHVRGQYETAVECLRQTILLAEDVQMQKRAILLCDDVYKSMGDTVLDEEIALLEQYSVSFADNGALDITERLAQAYTRKAQTDEVQAQGCYEKAMDLFLSIYEEGYVTYQLQENIAILYENLQRFDEAEAMLLSMVERYPERYEVYKRLAYLEADRQQVKENADRDYQKMLGYYEQAVERYTGKEQDAEMEMLEVMMQEIRDGGWL